MRRISSVLFMAFLMASLGCGYHFSARAPITLPRGVTDIYIGSVDNPTVEAWIDSFLRFRFQDEFTRRAQVRWVDPDAAQAYVNLIIVSYSVETELFGAQRQTIREKVTVTMETEFRDQLDGSLLWSSGAVSTSETFETGTREIDAGERALEDLIRMTADLLGADY